MKFSTFDIIKNADEIKELHRLLVEALKVDDDGKITVTHEEAQIIGDLITKIAANLGSKS